ncbi:hypothetical protein IIC38_17300 [candidate division KSB1 bacterium]|nr:hypothetical protein [candidate division KSB1 bacterium]
MSIPEIGDARPRAAIAQVRVTSDRFTVSMPASEIILAGEISALIDTLARFPGRHIFSGRGAKALHSL